VSNKAAVVANWRAMRCHCGIRACVTRSACAVKQGSDDTVWPSTGFPSASRTIVSMPEGVHIVMIWPFAGMTKASAAVALGKRMPRHNRHTSKDRTKEFMRPDLPRNNGQGKPLIVAGAGSFQVDIPKDLSHFVAAHLHPKAQAHIAYPHENTLSWRRDGPRWAPCYH
jgi:hypothetical protein